MSYYTKTGFMFAQEQAVPLGDEDVRQKLSEPDSLLNFFKAAGVNSDEYVSLDELEGIFKRLAREGDFREMSPLLEAFANSERKIVIRDLQSRLLEAMTIEVCPSPHIPRLIRRCPRPNILPCSSVFSLRERLRCLQWPCTKPTR